MGGPGDAIDVPLHYKDAAFVRSHFDAIEVRVPAAPRDDEIVVIAAVSHAREGRLPASAACGWRDRRRRRAPLASSPRRSGHHRGLMRLGRDVGQEGERA